MPDFEGMWHPRQGSPLSSSRSGSLGPCPAGSSGQWLPYLPFPGPGTLSPELGGAWCSRGWAASASPSCAWLRRSLPLPPGAGPPPPRSQRAWSPVRAQSPWLGQLGPPGSSSPAGFSAPRRPEASRQPGPSASPGGCTFRLCPELPMAHPLPVHQPGPGRHHLLPRPMQSPPHGSPCSAVTPRSLVTSGSQVTLGPSSAQTPHGPIQRQSHSLQNGQLGPVGPALPPPP